MITKNISWWGKDGRCVQLTTLPPSGADWLEMWDPNLLKPPRIVLPYSEMKGRSVWSKVPITALIIPASELSSIRLTSHATCSYPITTLISLTEFNHACQVSHITTKGREGGGGLSWILISEPSYTHSETFASNRRKFGEPHAANCLPFPCSISFQFGGSILCHPRETKDLVQMFGPRVQLIFFTRALRTVCSSSQ